MHRPNCPAHMCVVQRSYMCTRGVKSALDNALGNKPNNNNTTITLPTCANVHTHNIRLLNKVWTVHKCNSHTSSSCCYSQSSYPSCNSKSSHNLSSLPSQTSSLPIPHIVPLLHKCTPSTCSNRHIIHIIPNVHILLHIPSLKNIAILPPGNFQTEHWWRTNE